MSLTAIQSEANHKAEATSDTLTGILDANEQAAQGNESGTGSASAGAPIFYPEHSDAYMDAGEIPSNQRRILPKRGQGNSNCKWVDFADGGNESYLPTFETEEMSPLLE